MNGRIDLLEIRSPKQSQIDKGFWSQTFPYYAGYSEIFCKDLLASARLPEHAVVYDPWNGSGTTTHTASTLGLRSIGVDLNPVMIIVARARTTSPFEADSIMPLAHACLSNVQSSTECSIANDPLTDWFSAPTATMIRSVEISIRNHFVGSLTVKPEGVNVAGMSALAAIFYLAMFRVCRDLTAQFRSSNPTWVRQPKDDQRISTSLSIFVEALKEVLSRVSLFLSDQLIAETQPNGLNKKAEAVFLKNYNAVQHAEESATIDMVITSPPYCTRIDYSAATAVELAVIYPLHGLTTKGLGRQMLGSTRVSDTLFDLDEQWGVKCLEFLENVRTHPSKASKVYYFKTHLDYYHKLFLSLKNISRCIKKGGLCVIVAQDSYYKEVRNDLPSIITEMNQNLDLAIRREDHFEVRRSMAGVNRHAKAYQGRLNASENVLCFEKV